MDFRTYLAKRFNTILFSAEVFYFLSLMQRTIHFCTFITHLVLIFTKNIFILYYIFQNYKFRYPLYLLFFIPIFFYKNKKLVELITKESKQNCKRFVETQSKIKQKEDKIEINNMNNNKIEPKKTTTVNETEFQLMQMGFELEDIQRVMNTVKQKEKAIQILLGEKQSNKNRKQQQLMNLNEQNKNDNKMKDQKEQDDDQGFQSVQEEYKMVFLARMDLKLSLGKIAAQVATATLAAFKQLQSRADKDEMCEIAYYEWLQSGQKKIVVKVNSQQELMKLVQTIEKEKINVFVVRSKKEDQLQIPEGTVTVAAVGPAPQELVDKLTRHLKLF